MTEETWREIAKLFLDVAKYVITVFVLNTLFGDYNNKRIVYSLCIAIVVLCFIVSVVMFQMADNKKINSKDKRL